MGDNWTREEKFHYYFWLDNLILEHWGEYLDLKINGETDNEQECDQKLKLITFYQSLIDKLEEEFTWQELNAWYRKKYGENTAFIRYCKDMFYF